jgi:hypothetical protein
MRRIRRCDSRCHKAKSPRCKCWCGGAFHGEKGAANRESFVQAVEQGMEEQLLTEHGFKKGETAYIEQAKLDLGEGGKRG